MTIRSSRYDFGKCEVDYVTESEFYDNVTIRVRQVDEADEAQFTLSATAAAALAAQILKELGANPAPLIAAQLQGQQMALADA